MVIAEEVPGQGGEALTALDGNDTMVYRIGVPNECSRREIPVKVDRVLFRVAVRIAADRLWRYAADRVPSRGLAPTWPGESIFVIFA